MRFYFIRKYIMYPKADLQAILKEINEKETLEEKSDKLDYIIEQHFLRGFEEWANASNEVFYSKEENIEEQTINLDELDKKYIEVDDNFFSVSVAKNILLKYIEKYDMDWSDEIDKLTDDLIMLIKENNILKEKIARLERMVLFQSSS